MKTRLIPAAEGDKPTLRRLLELHLHDLSPFTGDVIGRDGRFGYRYLDFYWLEENRRAFLLEVENELAGFALVRLRVPGLLDSLSPVNHIAEFFILRKHRRQGCGKAAATLAFERFPGAWEVAQVAGHTPARAFWRAVIRSYTRGDFEEATLEGPEWFGTVQHFKTPG